MGLVSDPHNKVRTAIKQVVVFFAVKGLTLHLKKKLSPAKHSKVEHNKTRYFCTLVANVGRLESEFTRSKEFTRLLEEIIVEK